MIKPHLILDRANKILATVQVAIAHSAFVLVKKDEADFGLLLLFM